MTDDDLKTENAKLKTEVEDLKEKVKELEGEEEQKDKQQNEQNAIEDEDGWETVYGSQDTAKGRRLIMAGGGAHAWNYLVAGDDLYIEHYPFETTDGQIQTGKMLITHLQVVDRVKMVDKDYELKDDEEYAIYFPHQAY